jgi:hypothetical protein
MPELKFINEQVIIGRGLQNPGAYHRALAVAAALYAVWKWDARGRLVVHEPYEAHRKLQLSQRLGYSTRGSTNVYLGVHKLRPGEDYEIRPLNPETCQRLGISLAHALTEREAERFNAVTQGESCPECGMIHEPGGNTLCSR